jgi:hypothetical protein
MITLSIINACQSSFQRFAKLKEQILNCNANIYFNNQCLKRNITPKYEKIKIPNTSPAQKTTQQKIKNIRIKEEIKYLYAKKQKLNKQLYLTHLQVAYEQKSTWDLIQHVVEHNLQREAQAKYKKLDKKLNKLTKAKKNTEPTTTHTFYPRVINNTNIQLTDEEMTLLEKGPKYNMHTRKRNWIKNLAFETETTISMLPSPERDTYRKLAAEHIDSLLHKNHNQDTRRTHTETKTINSIKTKLNQNEAMLAKADKSNAIVLLPITQYEDKINEFITSNNLKHTNKDPTNKFQTLTRSTVNNSKTLIPKEERWKYTNMNPKAPTITGHIKIHKNGQPIRPVINWRHAPAFKLAKALNQTLKLLAPLPNLHNIQNTVELMDKLKEIKLSPHHTLASLDIANLYTSIPVKETRAIIARSMTKQKIKPSTRKELLKWLDTITKQNYFANGNNIVIQEDGLAMGAPTSGLIAEFFLQHLEKTHIPKLSKKHKLAGYYRYVDDILIIYNTSQSNITDILQDFNNIHPNMLFTAEHEEKQQLNFLDITIHKNHNEWEFSIHRKPTFTDTIIPYDSNHPHQHKHATTRYLHNRMHNYNIQGKHLEKETAIIANILHNNGFPSKPKKPHHPKLTNQNLDTEQQHAPKQWATFTYTGKETYNITKLFKNTNIKIGFKTDNNIWTALTQKPRQDIYTKSGVYKLTCQDCGKAYVGQTGRNFATRFKEHKNAFKTGNQSNKFTKHLTENVHQFGQIQDTLTVLHLQNKGRLLNTIENFYIHSEHKLQNHLNDESTIFPNRIFDTLIKANTSNE